MTEATALTRPRATPRLAGVLLAAGQSQRMGRNKLLTPWQGRPLAAHMLTSLHQAGLRPVVVVTGHQADRLIEALRAATAADSVSFVYNPDYAGGLASSVRAGVAALPDDIDGAVIAQADMPQVGAEVIACTDRGLRSGSGACDLRADSSRQAGQPNPVVEGVARPDEDVDRRRRCPVAAGGACRSGVRGRDGERRHPGRYRHAGGPAVPGPPAQTVRAASRTYQSKQRWDDNEAALPFER